MSAGHGAGYAQELHYRREDCRSSGRDLLLNAVPIYSMLGQIFLLSHYFLLIQLFFIFSSTSFLFLVVFFLFLPFLSFSSLSSFYSLYAFSLFLLFFPHLLILPTEIINSCFRCLTGTLSTPTTT